MEENIMYACKRVLIVDDEPPVVFFLRHGRKNLGDTYEIMTATSGAEALAKIKAASVDLLITDVTMPDMSGITLTEAARDMYPNLKVVWITAVDTWKAEAERLQVDRYLLKPVDVDMIRGVVKENVQDGDVSIPTAPAATDEKAVLILDDNDDIRRLFCRALNQAGYKSYPAADVEEARRLLAEIHFDVFLCDIHVGAQRGTDLLREQSARLSVAGTHVIMVSADPRYRGLCADMGVEFYMEKPVAIAPLITLVDRLTANRPSQPL